MAELAGENVHSIFTKEPEDWIHHVYKKVCILCEDGVEYSGIVYTVDPVSESYILANIEHETMKVDMILGHSISVVKVVSDITHYEKQQMDRLFRPASTNQLSKEDIKVRQSVVKGWLLKNRLPVEVGGTDGELLQITDALIIQPPYGPENCISTNEIILGKIQGLIKNMPADQSQW